MRVCVCVYSFKVYSDFKRRSKDRSFFPNFFHEYKPNYLIMFHKENILILPKYFFWGYLE